MTTKTRAETIAELERLDKERSGGDWSVYCQATTSPDDAKRELCEQIDSTEPFIGEIFLLNAGGKCPATTGCGPTSKANAYFIAAAPTMMRLIRDFQERERVLDEALSNLIDSIPGQTADADWWPDDLSNAFENAKQTLAKLNGDGWME